MFCFETGFPENMSFNEFCNRYEILVGMHSGTAGSTADCKVVCNVSFRIVCLN